MAATKKNPPVIGERHGRLEVVEIGPVVKKNRRVRVACDCGVEKWLGLCHIRSGETLSCGCLFPKHNLSKTKEYQAWDAIKQRCLNPRNPSAANYRNRGIKVCARWMGSFENFLADVGLAPTPQHSIERIDNLGDYSPENCKWATSKEQARNKRNSVYVMLDGKRMCLAAACEVLGITSNLICNRVHQQGMTYEEALAKPFKKRNKK